MLILSVVSYAGWVSTLKSWTSNAILTATDLNANFTKVNDGITEAHNAAVDSIPLIIADSLATITTATLAVTGNTTLTGTLGVTGVSTFTTIKGVGQTIIANSDTTVISSEALVQWASEADTSGWAFIGGKANIYGADGDAGSIAINTSDALVISNFSGGIDLTGSLKLEATTTSTAGVIYKGTTRFIHNFQHPTGSTAVPAGRNIFIGLSAGNFTMGSTATTTSHGSYNTGIGFSSLLLNTTGYHNSALGHQTLYNNSTGYHNSALGTSALVANTTGYNNTAVGAYALSSNTTGINNTAIGYSVADNITTGSSNIIIGNNVDAPSATANNQLNIGNAIYGDLSTGNVGIGNISPATALDVTGNITVSGTVDGVDVSSLGAAVIDSVDARRADGFQLPWTWMFADSTAVNDSLTVEITKKSLIGTKQSLYIENKQGVSETVTFVYDGTLENNYATLDSVQVLVWTEATNATDKLIITAYDDSTTAYWKGTASATSGALNSSTARTAKTVSLTGINIIGGAYRLQFAITSVSDTMYVGEVRAYTTNP